MKICMIGSSGHNHYVYRGLAEAAESGYPDLNVIGAAPGSEGENMGDVMQAVESAGHSPQHFADYRVMLDRLQPDVVTVACHFADMPAASIAALERDAHVFSDKPLATNFEDFARLRKAYEQAEGLHITAMMGMRYEGPFYAAWESVRGGTIGEVRLMTTQKSYRLGERDAFYRSRTSYGGTIPWIGSHAIDLMMWMGAASPQCVKPLSVYASHSAKANRDHGDLETSALVHLTFTDEVFGCASIDYLRPSAAPTHGDDRLRLAGSEGVIEVMGGAVTLIDAEGERQLEPAPDRSIFLDFIAGAAGEREPLLTAAESFRLTEICLQARRSADEGKIVGLGG